MARNSSAHRRILNDKADYIAGRALTCNREATRTAALIATANSTGETLHQIVAKTAFDKLLFGNAFIEVVTDRQQSFVALFHQDASRCRLARDDRHIIMHHNWAAFNQSEAATLPLYPLFEQDSEGLLRSVIHYKDYEPTFAHYGVPPYIAGMNVSAIVCKTDNWNISRLDNSFQLSGVMLLDGGVDNEAQAEEVVRTAQQKFAGQPGQVMFMIKECTEGDSSRFIPVSSSNEGDWRELHDQAVGDIVVAHSWFRSLSGLDYNASFSSERILQEYEVALNTVILGEQAELLEPVRTLVADITGEDASSLEVINQPPSRSKPLYMRIWEARCADGLDYDPDDPAQQLYLAQVTKYGLKNID